MPKPDNLIPEDLYINLLVEVQLLDAYIYTTDTLTNYDSLKLALFDHYEITEEQYRQSNAWYQSNIESHIARLDSVDRMLAREIEALSKAQESGEVSPFIRE